jgi:hypothetical protein
MNIEGGIILRQFFSQAEVPLAGAILQHPPVNTVKGVQSNLRSRQIGLTDVEVIHLDPPGLCAIRQGYQLPDGEAGIRVPLCDVTGMLLKLRIVSKRMKQQS